MKRIIQTLLMIGITVGLTVGVYYTTLGGGVKADATTVKTNTTTKVTDAYP